MATADELRAQIAAQKLQLEQARVRASIAYEEIREAEERQKLRAELERLRECTELEESAEKIAISRRQQIDRDAIRPIAAEGALHARTAPAGPGPDDKRHVKGTMDCDAAVVDGELEWSIKGFSWLGFTLLQDGGCAYAMSPSIAVGGHCFCLMYHPERGRMNLLGQRGSLVIRHVDRDSYEGVAFRYSVWIKSKDRGFVQWGDSVALFEEEDTHGMIFGPDVCDDPDTPAGLFRMSHSQLATSEWVIDDVLTAKLKVEVRPDIGYDIDERHVDDVVVPPSNLTDRLMHLLDNGAGCDVTCRVQGETIQAHSLILCAASNVLQRMLACGLQESLSKEIIIEDCEPQIFKNFLRYLYSDNFDSLESFIAGKVSEHSSGDGRIAANEVSTKMSILQQLLAVGHKYQVARLQLWCERELCRCITIEDVCTVLCQAHLYEAKQLEKRCLDFIKTHRNEVVRTAGFASLSKEWPQVSLKITLHIGAIDESSAAVAIEAQRSGHKRKRDECDY
eukprot:TRINITY_DN29746_c0_g1_i1.p1 TRINITY_DN29746_c0_g1~~TRINITY_DN29746_c0_g1_i1.p1  ORF type:complete len:507 (-),score=65.56 TRINITY_DN29746_c0_g1_i1:12-1532(-)